MNQLWVFMCPQSWTHLPLPSPSDPPGSSHCTSPERPVSCIEPRLAICFIYGNIHISMLFTQTIPPSPSSTESKSLFFISLSLLLSCIKVFPCGSAGKESTCSAGDLGLISGLGRSPGEGNGYPLQHSGLENSMYCIVHGFTKSLTWLGDFHFYF